MGSSYRGASLTGRRELEAETELAWPRLVGRTMPRATGLQRSRATADALRLGADEATGTDWPEALHAPRAKERKMISLTFGLQLSGR